ncbi:MAG: RuBisCO large subunit C-terminal-like domain-containing protein, partial [Candidatus Aenigmatarchaeota archaeon]
QDIDFPDEMIEQFEGPQLGIEGIRDLLGIHERPLLGTIVKPKLGLNAREHSKVAYKAWKGGLDVVKDDENLSSMKFNPFKERIRRTLKMRKRVEKETGDEKVYMPNITAPVSLMKKRADFVIDNGGKYVMIDILTTGWSGFQEMRNYLEGKNIAIHCHRAGHAAFTRDPIHGISMLTIAKLTRLIGGDQLHIGTVDLGKMHGGKDEVLDIEREIESDKVEAHKQVLKEDWLGMKKTFAVASGGLYPGVVPKLVERMGKDIVIQAGGGVHGNPDGTESGARAMKQALDAALNDIELSEYAKKHEELKKALEKWD